MPIREMADKTRYNEDVSREQAADLLQQLARELRSDGTADVEVGNKLLTLSPAPVLEYDITVEERSPMLGGHREEVAISLAWSVEEES